MRLLPIEKIEKETAWIAEPFPWAICIGNHGGGENFVMDRRTLPQQFGLLHDISSDEDFIPLGDSFEKFIKRLYDGTAFEKYQQ